MEFPFSSEPLLGGRFVVGIGTYKAIRQVAYSYNTLLYAYVRIAQLVNYTYLYMSLGNYYIITIIIITTLTVLGVESKLVSAT